MKDGSTYKDVADFNSRLGAYWKLTKVAGGYTYQNVYTGLYLAPKEEKGTRVMSLRKNPTRSISAMRRLPAASTSWLTRPTYRIRLTST